MMFGCPSMPKAFPPPSPEETAANYVAPGTAVNCAPSKAIAEAGIYTISSGHPDLVKFKEVYEYSHRAITNAMVEKLYGDNALVRILGSSTTKLSLRQRVKSWVGQLFLKIANALGEYNDDA